jgi:protein-disulfide isomerase
MKSTSGAKIARAVVTGLILALALGSIGLTPGQAQEHHQDQPEDLRGQIEAIVKDYLAAHPDEVGEIAKSYFARHPEAVGQILAEVLKQRHAATANAPAPATTGAAAAASANLAADRGAAVVSNAAQLFTSKHQVTLGNPNGDVTLVEFFDYSCGYCKRALPDMLALIKDDPKLKIVLKEFPILGPGSLDAAQVAVAVRMQDGGGQKYLAFHQELFNSPGPASKEKALVAAKNQGLDMAQLEQDMTSPEVADTLTEDMKLASAVKITGTPGYVIGKDVVLGAVGITGLKRQIDAARSMPQ